MYSSGSSVLAVRAKGSVCPHQHQHHHHRHHHPRCYCSGGKVTERCGCCSLGAAHPPCAAALGFSVRSVLANPGFLYGYLLRQSALIRWTPSEIVVSRGSGAAAAARYSRLTAAWDGDPCGGGGRRAWRKCGNRRVSSTAAVFDEGFDDMLGLLAEAEECCGEDNDAAADGAVEESYSKEKVGSDSRHGLHRRFYDHKIDSSEEEDRKSRSARQSASASSSSSGDASRNQYFRRRVWDESSGSYYRNGEEKAEKEARELRKCEEDTSRLRSRYHASDNVADLNIEDARKKEQWTGVKDSNTASRAGYVLHSRDRIQKDQRFTGREESKEELQKASHVRQSSVTDRSVVDKKVVNVTKEETSAAALLEVVRRQQDEMIQLRKDYQDLLKTTQVQNVGATKASASCSVINTGVEKFVENSILPMGLLEEVQRQRNEIEKLNENYQLLMRAHKMQETCMINESNLPKSFGVTLENREKISTSAVNLVEKRTVHLYNIDGQKTDDSKSTSSMLARPNELEKQHQQLKRSDICESDVRRNTNYGKGVSTNFEDRKKKAASAVSLVEELQKHSTDIAQGLQNIGDTNLKATSHSLTEQVDIQKDSAEIDSKSQKCYMTTTGDQQYGTKSAIKQASSINEKVSGSTGSRKNFKKQTNIVETHDSGAPKTCRTQGLVKTIEKDQEESSTSLLLVRLSRDKRVQIDEHVTEEINVTNDTQTDNNLTAELRCEADKANAKSSDPGKSTVSTLNLVCEEDLMSDDCRHATQQLILRADPQQSSPENFNGGPVNLSDSQASSSKLAEKEGYSSSVFVQEAKQSQKAGLIEQTLGAFRGSSESWHTSGSMQMHELDYHTESDRSQLVNADVLESAMRLAESSSHYVGEFVDQLHQKISTLEETDITSYNSPETQMEVSQPSSSEKPKAPIEHEIEVPKMEDTKQYSSWSKVTGPSDEIWDVRGAQEPSPTEEPEKSSGVKMPGTAGTHASASDGAIIKRSSKSLWSYIAEIVRMSWISSNRSEKSMMKSGAKSSSDESVKSDAWYSGHEPEGDHEKNVKDGHPLTKQTELNRAAISKPHSRPSSTSGQVRSEVTGHGGKRVQENIEMPNPPAFTGGSYESDGSTPAPTLEYLTPSLDNLAPFDSGKKLEHMHSTEGAASIHSVKATTSTPAIETTGESTLLGTTSSSTYEEETETDRLHVAQVSFIKSQEQETGGIFEIDGIEVKDAELKRRKLQRKKQVLREEFEEWEEAYKLESELRKIDEYFMREALLEAKKAAEMWEVPVGAVLVQDGKIIARGCNLVEDLRDSTAHAEMICIREASNLLKTWRLAGTTLYVTLEPCPMCAGAILQARIDIVVWGAPNKLLGADGSWVRLFPGGGDKGKQGLDQADQAVGPVHPFHPKITVRRGVLATECADTMQQFFQRRRKKQKPEQSPSPYLPVSYPAKIMTKMQNIFSMMTCL